MRKVKIKLTLLLFTLLYFFNSCGIPELVIKQENKSLPNSYLSVAEPAFVLPLNKEFFEDSDLRMLIDTALRNNQELNIVLKEIEITKNESEARKGAYLPLLNLKAGTGFDKSGEYTWKGSVEKNLEEKESPKILSSYGDYMVGFGASWEIDVWKKLRNSRKAAISRYLASIEGKNFMVTNLVSEIASSYYELMALDNLLMIINKNIDIQTSALKIIKQEMLAAKVSQLAVNRFEAQVLNTTNLQFEIKQRIVETESRIRFLTGKIDLQIPRKPELFLDLKVDPLQSGIPSQLLTNRPDIKQAELELAAAKLDVKSARAEFYPDFKIDALSGFQAFNPSYLLNPGSIAIGLGGELMAPLLNRKAIKADYKNAGARQIQALYKYEQTILNAFLDVRNQLSKTSNYNQSFEVKKKEVDILNQSVNISNNLFKSARADYAEVLLTQREALESRIELVEIRLNQLEAKVNLYRAMGGGWR